MTTIWSEIGDRFLEFLRELSTDLRAEEKGFRVCFRRHGNEFFPVRAAVSYSPLTSPGDEQLVVSFDVQGSGEALEAEQFVREHAELLTSELQVRR